MQMQNLDNIKRREDLVQFVGKTAVELGVWKGDFSKYLIQNSDCNKLYSIDAWDDASRGHDDEEYIHAANNLKEFGLKSMVLRSYFNDALSMFPDEYFDFVYIDGYAHTGQNEGETINSWWSKVKVGGFFGGHDYDESFPKTIKHVDNFVSKHGLDLYLTQEQRPEYPSWFVFK